MVEGSDNTNVKPGSAGQQHLSERLNRNNGGIYSEKAAFQTTSPPDLVALGFAQTEGLPGDRRINSFQRATRSSDAASYAAKLEKQYHVSFSKNGEKAEAKNADGTISSGVSHAPTMRELSAVEDALKRDPSAKGMKFYFLNQSLEKNPDVSGRYGIDTKGHPSVFLMPRWDKFGAATPAERKSAAQGTMSEALMHELVHHEHPAKTPEEQAKEKQNWQKLGWKQMPDRRWALEAKDGSYYEPVEDEGFAERFLHKDAQGTPLDKNGKPTPDPRQMDFVDAKTALDHAKIRPMNDYIPHPEEEMADALSVYREDRVSRGVLVHHFKSLYDQIKQIDQADIDQLYPPHNGRESKIRSPEGTIVDNTPANRARVAQFEKEAATKDYKIR